MKETTRYIIGYLIGFSLFVLLIPFGFYKLTYLDFLFHGKVLIAPNLFRYIISSLLLLNGAIFAIWSNFFLLRIGKGGPVDAFGVSISPQTRKLVTTGPYSYSRNPMVFGAFSLYLAVVIYLNSITGLICLLAFLGMGIIFLKFSEEKRLLKDFGEDYKAYRKEVPMIFPYRRKRRKTS